MKLRDKSIWSNQDRKSLKKRVYDSTKNETHNASKEIVTKIIDTFPVDLLPVSLDQNYIDQIKKTLPNYL